MNGFSKAIVAVLLLGTAKPVLAAPRVTDVPAGVTAFKDLTYVEGSKDAHQTLDLYVPQTSAKPLPLIIYVHGGGWNGDDKSSCPPLDFVKNGYAAASVEYRFASGAKFPAQIQDCQAAVRWLRANAKKYNLDSDRFGVWGESAGGHLVALLGTAGGGQHFPAIGGNLDQSDRVQAVCDFFGPTDFTTVVGQGNANAQKPWPKAPDWNGGKVYAFLIDADPETDITKSHAASPIYFATSQTPPFLIFHGTWDQLVPFQQSEQLVDRLKSLGVEVTLQPFRRMEHSGAIFWSDPALQLVRTFFDNHLKGQNNELKPLTPEQSTVGAP